MTSLDFITSEAENTDRIVLYREGLFWKAYERSAFAVCSQLRPFKPTKKALKALGGGQLVSIGFPTHSEATVLEGIERIAEEPMRLVLQAPRPIVAHEFEAWKASLPLKEPSAKRRGRAAWTADADEAAGRLQAYAGAGDRTGGLSSDALSLGVLTADGLPSGVLSEALSGVVASASVPTVAPPGRAHVPPAGESLSTLMSAVQDPIRSGACPEADFTLTAACRVAESLRNFNLAEKTPMECMLYISELKKILANR